MQLSRHTGTGWSGGGGGSSGTRGRTDSDGAEQRPPGRPLLCLPERAVCAQLERGQVHREAWRRGETRRRWRRRRRQRHARADGFGRGGAATAWAAAALSASARCLRSSSAALHILLGDLRARGNGRGHVARTGRRRARSSRDRGRVWWRALPALAQRGARRRSWQARQGSRRRWRAGARCRGRRPSAATSW